MANNSNVAILHETLQILKKGSYKVNGKNIKLKLTPDEMEEIHVLLPDDVKEIEERTDLEKAHVIGRCGHGCQNADSFTVARQQYENFSYSSGEDSKPVLVLNLANPVNPGGGVRRGAKAQEEDLCRKSSLLLSLESKKALKYYKYNRSLNTYMGSDAMMFTPKVEIIRDENGELLEDSVIVSVLTCAAPMIKYGKAGLSEQEYEAMFYKRIMSMLKCTAYFGYEHLVLGAWGCGAFGNDARIVSDLFYKALKEMDYNGFREKDLFKRIDFAVLDRTADQYNFKEFYRNFDFNNFFRDVNQEEVNKVLKRKKASEDYLDKIRGCMIGGAAGDALGYTVEFYGEKDIFEKYGENGIQGYSIDLETGEALISDDTQMALFTANGILVADTRLSLRGIGGIPHDYIPRSYQDWLRTQEISYKESRKLKKDCRNNTISWLLDVPELYARRAPGMTCLSALNKQKSKQSSCNSYIDNPQNDSKGCGGIMRVAPLGLKHYPNAAMEELDREGAEIAAITHGHPLGYMPAAVLVHIICRLVYSKKKQTLKEIVTEARNTVAKVFDGNKYLKELTDIIDKAVELSENKDEDINNIHQLGEGWVAEETLGIAIYCSLRHQDDFSAGIIAAVNHKGDSDSTGAVTGNILGALLGYNAIEEKWKRNLELSGVILEMADDICHGCLMEEFSHYEDPDWVRKYIHMQGRKL